MEKQPKTRKHYTSDLTDAQWKIIEPLIPAWNVGRQCRTNMREVINAIFYLLVTRCGWRNLPHDIAAGRNCSGRLLSLATPRNLGQNPRFASGKGSYCCRS
jgi:hypothetical protein